MSTKTRATIPPAAPALAVPRTITKSRVRLRTETEVKLAEIDARSAACYADAEMLAARLVATADTLSSESAIPHEVDAMEDTSAVHHMENIREKLISGEQEALTREPGKPS